MRENERERERERETHLESESRRRVESEVVAEMERNEKLDSESVLSNPRKLREKERDRETQHDAMRCETAKVKKRNLFYSLVLTTLFSFFVSNFLLCPKPKCMTVRHQGVSLFSFSIFFLTLFSFKYIYIYIYFFSKEMHLCMFVGTNSLHKGHKVTDIYLFISKLGSC